MRIWKIYAFIMLVLALCSIWYFSFFNLALSMVIFLFSGIFGGNIGYHRLISHGSFKVKKPIRYFIFLNMIIAGFGPPVDWAFTHREHHRFADGSSDPHSPDKIGLFRAWFYLWPLKKSQNLLTIRDLLKQKDLMWFNRYYYVLSSAYFIVLFLIKSELVIWAYAVPMILCLNGVSALVVLPNYFGYRNFNTNDLSRNSWLAHILSLGEGWHNNHHNDPRSYIQGRKNWWELDWCAVIIEWIQDKPIKNI